MRQHPVLAGDGNNVGGNTGSNEVKVFVAFLQRNAVMYRIRLYELKADAGPAKFFIWISAISLLGIEYRHSRWNYGAGQVVIADDEVNFFFVGVEHLVIGFDAAVERNDKCEIVFCCVIYALRG